MFFWDSTESGECEFEVSQGTFLAIAKRRPPSLFAVVADKNIVAKKGSFAVAIELGFLQSSNVDLVCF